MEADKTLPKLSDEEIRVLGALLEKSKTTPDYYPLSLNALTAACNQKSSRKPVVEYSEEIVLSAVKSLKGRSLAATAIGDSIRTTKYKHNFSTLFPLTNGEIAILCLLFLRGAQTPGELNTNSGRLHEFQSLESVHEALNKLADAQPPMVRVLSRRAGQKETRYIQLFGNYVEVTGDETVSDQKITETNNVEARLSALEMELAQVKESVNKLMKELMG